MLWTACRRLPLGYCARRVDGRPLFKRNLHTGGESNASTSDGSSWSAKSDLALQRWLLANAVAEARANGDSFNGRVFERQAESLAPATAKARGALSPCDMDCLTMYLWDFQPPPQPAFLRPLRAQ